MKRGTQCAVHVHRDFVPQEDHHILPQEFGGKSAKENMARVCSNGHGDVHYYLNLLLKYDGQVPWNDAKMFGMRVKSLAQRGYDGIAKNPALLEAVKLVGTARADGAPSHVHEYAWRKVNEVLRGCPFGMHAPGEKHHYSCWVAE